MKEADALAARGTWHLFEWCCEPDSLLSAWFQNHGQAATRLGLPQHDMSLRESVQKVVRQVRELASGGTDVFFVGSVALYAMERLAAGELPGGRGDSTACKRHPQREPEDACTVLLGSPASLGCASCVGQRCSARGL